MSSKPLFIILGNHLFPLKEINSHKDSYFFMAEDYELSGGAMINVIRYGALNSLQMDRSEMCQEDLVEGITKELKKEGKTA